MTENNKKSAGFSFQGKKSCGFLFYLPLLPAKALSFQGLFGEFRVNFDRIIIKYIF